MAAGARAEPAEAVLKSRPFDPRITPARPDFAARHLAGSVEAQRFVQGEAFEIGAAHAPLRSAPSHEATLQTEALKGERMTVYEAKDGWAWGQLAGDSYVGYMPASALVRLALQRLTRWRRCARSSSPALRSSFPRRRRFRSAAGLPSPHRRGVCDHRLRRSCVRAPSRARDGARDRFRRGRGAVLGNTLSVGRQDQSRPRLLGIGAACAQRLRHPLSARHRHAGAGAGQRARAPVGDRAIGAGAISRSGRAMS